ncbi:MAG: hypothetical protein ACKPKO_58065, partial [Candidatus Fonsibacter sp.]
MDIEMAPVVDIVTKVIDAEEMPTVQVDVTGESPAEQPKQYKLIPSEESDAEEGVPETFDKLLWPPRILDNYPCPVLDSEPALLSGIRPAVASEPTKADMASIVETDRLVAETCQRSLAGSYREGTLRCLMDLSGTFPVRPANAPQIARGQ